MLQVKKLLAGDDVEKPLQVHWRLLAGSTAGVIAQTTIYPMEVCVGGCVCACAYAYVHVCACAHGNC